jgi:parvulin-like peptidyl-prolyl isomerase
MKPPIVFTAAWICALAITAMLAIAPAVQAQSAADPDQVLVENRWAKVTRGDYEAELLRLPPERRGGFAVDGKRVIDLLVRMLVTKSLAAQARAGDLYKDAEMRRRRDLEMDRADATLLVSKLEEDAGRSVDARKSQFEARARELYLAGREQYRVPDQVAVSHILFDTKKRSPDEALKLAKDARAKVLAGADFNELAKEISDDPSAQANRGHLDYFDSSRMDPAFSSAAFALKNVGNVSEPVLSSFGYHIIRLDGRKPSHIRDFDEVKDQIIAEQRKKFIDDQRLELIGKIRNDPSSKMNEAAVDALMIKIDPDIFKKALEAVAPK